MIRLAYAKRILIRCTKQYFGSKYYRNNSQHMYRVKANGLDNTLGWTQSMCGQSQQSDRSQTQADHNVQMIVVDIFGGEMMAHITCGCNVQTLDAFELKTGGSRWFCVGWCQNSSLVQSRCFVELYVVLWEKAQLWVCMYLVLDSSKWKRR